jgi:hypothetical protein
MSEAAAFTSRAVLPSGVGESSIQLIPASAHSRKNSALIFVSLIERPIFNIFQTPQSDTLDIYD